MRPDGPPRTDGGRHPHTASGQRVVQRDETPSGSSTKTFIGDLYEHTVASFVPTEHRYKVLVGSRQVAEVVRGGPEDVVLYLHDDHLGSTTLITRQDGNVAETRSYEPFGGMTAQGTTGVLSSFTGHNDDAGIGLVNMRGRLYDAKIGRFVTPDPFTTNPGSSQGWNRYAYVENNPLGFTDPSGFDCVSACGSSLPDDVYACATHCHGGDTAKAAQDQARTEAETERAGQQSGQASADAAAAIAQAQADAQRGFEQAQQGFAQGQASLQTGQPLLGYGQPTLGPPPPSAPNSPSVGWTAARIATGFIPFVGNLVTINDPNATDDEKGWALVGLLFDAATLGAGAPFVGAVKVGIRGASLLDDVARGANQFSRSAAFRKAKELGGIPRSAQPVAVRTERLTDQPGNVGSRVYEFVRGDGSTVTIREHSLGHTKGALDPHFNVEVRPPGGGARQPLVGGADDHVFFTP